MVKNRKNRKSLTFTELACITNAGIQAGIIGFLIFDELYAMMHPYPNRNDKFRFL